MLDIVIMLDNTCISFKTYRFMLLNPKMKKGNLQKRAQIVIANCYIYPVFTSKTPQMKLFVSVQHHTHKLLQHSVIYPKLLGQKYSICLHTTSNKT